jgi:hypothetical protein
MTRHIFYVRAISRPSGTTNAFVDIPTPFALSACFGQHSPDRLARNRFAIEPQYKTSQHGLAPVEDEEAGPLRGRLQPPRFLGVS